MAGAVIENFLEIPRTNVILDSATITQLELRNSANEVLMILGETEINEGIWSCFSTCWIYLFWRSCGRAFFKNRVHSDFYYSLSESSRCRCNSSRWLNCCVRLRLLFSRSSSKVVGPAWVFPSHAGSSNLTEVQSGSSQRGTMKKNILDPPFIF